MRSAEPWQPIVMLRTDEGRSLERTEGYRLITRHVITCPVNALGLATVMVDRAPTCPRVPGFTQMRISHNSFAMCGVRFLIRAARLSSSETASISSVSGDATPGISAVYRCTYVRSTRSCKFFHLQRFSVIPQFDSPGGTKGYDCRLLVESKPRGSAPRVGAGDNDYVNDGGT